MQEQSYLAWCYGSPNGRRCIKLEFICSMSCMCLLLCWTLAWVETSILIPYWAEKKGSVFGIGRRKQEKKSVWLFAMYMTHFKVKINN